MSYHLRPGIRYVPPVGPFPNQALLTKSLNWSILPPPRPAEWNISGLVGTMVVVEGGCCYKGAPGCVFLHNKSYPKQMSAPGCVCFFIIRVALNKCLLLAVCVSS